MSDKIQMVSGKAVVLPGDDIDTDRIVPARFLRCVTFEGLGETLFRDERFTEDGALIDHPLNDARMAGASIMVSGRNFGCGSSREHAPQAIYRAGFRAVVAESFAEIFAANSLALGLVCVSVSSQDMQALHAEVVSHPWETITIDLTSLQLRTSAKEVQISIPEKSRRALREGRWDPLTELLETREKTARVYSSLPYLNWTQA
ncbi:MAG: 3-isopropylmalate/(R)-2-methylmalate dehydratase small subunit [Bradymonadia bacterium]|jgi:3-isopropylmalate/(R)-2-methylmalate dehydratase small subunit